MLLQAKDLGKTDKGKDSVEIDIIFGIKARCFNSMRGDSASSMELTFSSLTG